MAYKFPWTNYHELNLDWILNTVKELFSKTEQNNAIVEQYDGRLTEVELTADNAQTAAEQAQQNSTAALDLAQGAQTTATQAQQAAAQAQQAAGQAQQAAGQALEAAATAQQTATQAQQTAQNFDGRITQAENNAANALQAAQAFDEQVQGAITAANNANEAATLALTTATETSRELAAQRSTLEGIVSDGVTSLQDAAQDATEEIEAAGQSVLDSIPADYTALSELVDKKADVIYNTAAGDIASFNDGADDMKIKSLIVNIEPVQSGSGDPSPDNVRPISGWTGAEVTRDGKNLIGLNTSPEHEILYSGVSARDVSDNSVTLTSITTSAWRNMSLQYKLKAGTYTLSLKATSSDEYTPVVTLYKGSSAIAQNISQSTPKSFTLSEESVVEFRFFVSSTPGAIRTVRYYDVQLELGSTATDYEPYTGNQISVNWEDEAGTVYGGTLDVISGLLTDNAKRKTNFLRGAQDSSGKLYNIGTVTDGYYSLIQTDYLSRVLCSALPILGIQDAKNSTVPCLTYLATSSTGNFYVGGFVDKETELDALLADSDFSVVYPLSAPITYELTPQEVKTLFQYNNIWSDAGSVYVEYPADTKTYIDNKFAELQALILEH